MPPHYHFHSYSRRRYGFGSFLGDCFMTALTCGFWLIWVFVREMRNR